VLQSRLRSLLRSPDRSKQHIARRRSIKRSAPHIPRYQRPSRHRLVPGNLRRRARTVSIKHNRIPATAARRRRQRLPPHIPPRQQNSIPRRKRRSTHLRQRLPRRSRILRLRRRIRIATRARAQVIHVPRQGTRLPRQHHHHQQSSHLFFSFVRLLLQNGTASSRHRWLRMACLPNLSLLLTCPYLIRPYF